MQICLRNLPTACDTDVSPMFARLLGELKFKIANGGEIENSYNHQSILKLAKAYLTKPLSGRSNLVRHYLYKIIILNDL